jgi:hypothetical protein
MIRKFICAAVVACVTFGVALAEEFGASITKVDGNKVTFHKTKFDKDAKKVVKGDEMTLTVAKDVKINKGKTMKGKTEVGEALENGLKNEAFTKISEKGLNVRITTSDDNKSITQIVVTGGGKGKGKGK